MVERIEDTCIRIRSEMNEWMDCIFIVIKMDDIILKITAEIVITQEDVDDIMSTALDSSTLQCWCSEVNVVGRYLGEYASE